MEKDRKHYTIKDWPEYERPRERLLHHGPEYLSDAELLAILINKGYAGKTSVEIARSLLTQFGTLRNIMSASYSEMKEIKGIGKAKYAQIKAALEMGVRLSQEKILPGKKIKKAQDIVDYYCAEMKDKKKELFHIILLDVRYQIIRNVLISMGSLSETTVHPREVMKPAILSNAASILVGHNHPSGQATPSREDIEVTKRLVEAGRIIGIDVLDHLILGDEEFVSLKEKGYV